MGSTEDEVLTVDIDAKVAEKTEEDFAVETADEPEEEIIPVPKYDTMFTGFLTVPELDVETENIGKNTCIRIKMSCFNCAGEHNLNDCTERRDHGKIAKNRRAHQANRPPSNIRYHEKFDNKYSKFSPGVMSPALRKALGLYDNQLSETVYRMRLIGYPPGWLIDAREHTGELTLFGGDGEAVSQPGGEDGEVSGKAKYRPEKLIEYPGFNSPLPGGFVEEYGTYRLPKIQPTHSLERWKEIMNKNRVTPYRKRKMKPENTGHIDTTSSQDNTLPELNTSDEDETPTKKKFKIDTTLEDGEIDSSAIGSTTRELGFTLDTEPNEDSKVDDSDDKADDDDSKPGSPERNGRALLSLASSVEDYNGADDPGAPNSCSTPATTKVLKKRKTFRRSSSKGFVLGALIPDSITQYNELPDADKWTADVTDHIVFENLSDSVGTWDKIKGVMKKVKDTMHGLHGDD